MSETANQKPHSRDKTVRSETATLKKGKKMTVKNVKKGK